MFKIYKTGKEFRGKHRYIKFSPKAFWKDVLEQNRTEIKEYFHPDAHINWHCTDERFTVDEFITANCEYPGEWAGETEREERFGDLIITVERVYTKDHTASFHAVSFIKLKDEKIIEIDEYWGDDGMPPEWRKNKKIGVSIKQKG